MKISVTKHFLQRTQERGISMRQLARAIKEPDLVSDGDAGRVLHWRDFGAFVVVVVIAQDGGLITAYQANQKKIEFFDVETSEKRKRA